MTTLTSFKNHFFAIKNKYRHRVGTHMKNAGPQLVLTTCISSLLTPFKIFAWKMRNLTNLSDLPSRVINELLYYINPPLSIPYSIHCIWNFNEGRWLCSMYLVHNLVDSCFWPWYIHYTFNIFIYIRCIMWEM